MHLVSTYNIELNSIKGEKQVRNYVVVRLQYIEDWLKTANIEILKMSP